MVVAKGLNEEKLKPVF